MVDYERAKDHYELLGVSRDAPDEVVRAAYKALAAKHHPDRNPGDRRAERTLKQLNAAFEVLSDPAKRKEYDDQVVNPRLGREPTSTPSFRPQPAWGPARDRIGRVAPLGKAGGFGRLLFWGLVCAAFFFGVYQVGRGGALGSFFGSLRGRLFHSVPVTDDPEIYDRQTRARVHVPPDQAQAGLVSGMYELDDAGPRVRLVDKKGDHWVVEPNRVASSLATGEFRLQFALFFVPPSRGKPH
jgi:curved DNA-binding protein CbpA